MRGFGADGVDRRIPLAPGAEEEAADVKARRWVVSIRRSRAVATNGRLAELTKILLEQSALCKKARR